MNEAKMNQCINLTKSKFQEFMAMTEKCNHCRQVFKKSEIQNLLGSDFEIIARVCTGCYALLR